MKWSAPLLVSHGGGLRAGVVAPLALALPLGWVLFVGPAVVAGPSPSSVWGVVDIPSVPIPSPAAWAFTSGSPAGSGRRFTLLHAPGRRFALLVPPAVAPSMGAVIPGSAVARSGLRRRAGPGCHCGDGCHLRLLERVGAASLASVWLLAWFLPGSCPARASFLSIPLTSLISRRVIRRPTVIFGRVALDAGHLG